jgi:hypothetical protein
MSNRLNEIEDKLSSVSNPLKQRLTLKDCSSLRFVEAHNTMCEIVESLLTAHKKLVQYLQVTDGSDMNSYYISLQHQGSLYPTLETETDALKLLVKCGYLCRCVAPIPPFKVFKDKTKFVYPTWCTACNRVIPHDPDERDEAQPR